MLRRPDESAEPGGKVIGERVGKVFDALLARDQIRIYPTEAERTHALAGLAAASIVSGDQGVEPGVVVMADTREQVAALNGAIRDRLVAAGRVDDTRVVITAVGEQLGVGDRVATRRNARDLGVANRDTWTITGIADDGALTLHGDAKAGIRTVPALYVREQVELAYATTVYGAQGETTRTGHLLLGEHTTGSAAYVGMTRGREDNVAHLVAEDLDAARTIWDAAFGRDRADLGPSQAARRAAADVERYAPHRPLPAALAELRAAWKTEQDLRDAIGRTTRRRDTLSSYGAAYANLTSDRVARIDDDLAELTGELHAADEQVRVRLHEPAIRTLPPGQIEEERADWLHQRQQAHQAAGERRKARQSAHNPEPCPGYPRTPDRGRGIGR
ncbi:MAG: hypothetical protein ABI873_17755 [Marmoricola sp.]